MARSGDQTPPGTRGFVAATVFAFATLLLVGGTAAPLNVLLCFLASLPVLYMLLGGARAAPLGWPVWLALALYALAWLQLLPLPPALWTALPGRELAVQVLTVAGLPPGWRPVALDPGAAAISLVSITAPLVLLVAITKLTPGELERVLRAIVMLALLTAILGVVQRVTGGLNFYDTAHAGYATGLFANRNHHAAFLACALLFLPAIASRESRRDLGLCAAASIILYVGILATTSRAGIVLGTAALPTAWIVLVRPGWRVLLAGGIAALVAGWLLLQVPALAPVFDRFGALGEDQRLIMAEGSAAAARAFFPWGSGWGSFVPVYMAFEDLDTMTGRYIVAAHNDYLQLVVEGGLFGLLVALAGPATFAAFALRNWRGRASAAAWSLWLAGTLLLLHSLVDFPLRTGALAALLALSVAAQEILRTPLPSKRDDG
ncbi:O-antigen ligase family protein [Erythrobacter litoralis]|uniref:O-antigen ligase-related domain-containing protein n=1 Tax=Erythrobacter litoralis (strain HTCC2594) TaxID=314225 RepID=Q2N712_ERYLH|nr:O-antigen ligase family protein [Erythrobacter litoralis]ABC64529.1 hypothetical protein ELI_12185 [Erythrobacter litoralis HTCC2594]